MLGHEGAGIVEQVGSHCTTLQPGDHVVMGFNSCGQCAACLQRTPYCEDLMRIRLGLDRPDIITEHWESILEIYRFHKDQKPVIQYELSTP